jgi:HEAT repeat protein
MKKPTLVSTLLLVSVGLAATGCMQEDRAKTPQFTGPVRQLPAPPPPNPRPIDLDLKARARQEITNAARSHDPLVRAHAMESIRQVGGKEGVEEVLWALNDPEPVVRYAATLAAGEMRLAEAHRALLKMVDDPDKTVQVAVRFALHRLHDTRRSHDLEKFARDRDVTVRADTAMVLGMLGEPSAVNILKDMQYDRDAAVRIQVAEALWRLGDKSAREQLVAATFSHYVDDQAVAYLALAEPRDPQVLPHVRSGLTSPYNQIALIAARAAGMLGSDAGYTLATEGATSQDPDQRTLAAFALGAIGRTDSQDTLAKLLMDPNPDVRLASATALLELQEGR